MYRTIQRTAQSARKPTGGYCFINATALVVVYVAYRQSIIRLLDLRVWLACHELGARRCGLQKGQRPRYTVEELHRLVGGVGGEHLRNSVRRLETVGLLVWRETGLDPTLDVSKLPDGFWEQFEIKLTLVQNVRRKVPVPRRVIRMLAQGTTRSQAATVLGHLLRGLYYRNGRCTAGGTCKASWVAEVFDVDVRNVKAARKRLVEMGWLVLQLTPQRRLNRWGISFTVNLDWSPSPQQNRDTEAPPPGQLSTTGLPPPRKNQELSTRSKHQKPATRRPKTGVCKETGKQEKPSLRSLQPADLSDSRRLSELFKQAQRDGLVTDCECDRLRFFAAAERARSVATRNTCGLFATLVRRQLWHFITQRDEDTARWRLRAIMYAPDLTSSRPATSGVPGVTGNFLVGAQVLEGIISKTAKPLSPEAPAERRTRSQPVLISAIIDAAGVMIQAPPRC